MFAAVVALWQRAGDWAGVSFPRRVVLALRVSRNWWLAYSVGYLAFSMGCLSGGLREGLPVIIVACVLAALLSVTVRLDEH